MEQWVCKKCNRKLEPRATAFEYMGRKFTMDLPRCPSCGLVHISEDIVVNKIAAAEMALEEK